MTLFKQRIISVMNKLKQYEIKKVADLGCGDGKFIDCILVDQQFDKVLGIDVSQKHINKIQKKHSFNKKLNLINKSFFEYIPDAVEYEAIVLMEVIEHFNMSEVEIIIDLILNYYSPKLCLITTPNRSYNYNLLVLHNGLRHSSHIFELSDTEVSKFINTINKKHVGYIALHEYCDSGHATHLITIEKRLSDD